MAREKETGAIYDILQIDSRKKLFHKGLSKLSLCKRIGDDETELAVRS